jgi:hypothetical protein
MQPTGQPPGQPPAQGAAAAPPNPAQTAGIILCVCALAILIALFTKGWATASEGRSEIGAGLLGFEGCGGGQCESVDWDKGEKMLDIPSDVGMFRILGLLCGLAAVGGIAAAGVMALMRNTGKIPLKPIQGVMGAASFTLTYFAIRLSMSDDDVNFGPGFSVFLGIGGLIAAGIVMQTMLRPLIQQAKAAAPALPMAQAVGGAGPGAAPGPCPKCGGQLQFVAQYQRWYCTACQQYV